ncbi:MAG: hypothetical protein ACRDQ7_03070 [Haloechinothrix sp.]
MVDRVKRLSAPQHEGAAARVARIVRDPSLFAFDPVRRAVLLVAGDKAGNWKGWYDVNIPLADKRYDEHLAELDTREYR